MLATLPRGLSRRNFRPGKRVLYGRKSVIRHTYNYAGRNPTNLTDPNGLSAAATVGFVGAAAVTACILTAYIQGKNYEALAGSYPAGIPNAPRFRDSLGNPIYSWADRDRCKDPNTQYVYDKYVHCYTACAITHCFQAAGVIGGAAIGGPSGLGPGYLTGWVGGATFAASLGGLFELVQGALNMLGYDKVGHGEWADEKANLDGTAVALTNLSCEAGCAQQNY